MPHTLLTGPLLEAALASVPAWHVADGKLHRRFQFRDFRHAFAFMAHAALAAEAMNHHPEWRNVYRTVDVWLVTHDAGGITAADVDLARTLDAIA